MPARELKPDELRKTCDPSTFMFKTTEDFAFEREPEHQERGVKSIEFGLNVNSTGYNIFVCGSSDTGRNAQVNKAVNEIAARQKTPDDWVYVYNFIHEDEPIAMKLPAGSGKGFKKDIDEMIGELRHTIPRAFESDDYEKRKHALLREYKQKRDTTLEEVEDVAFKEGFVLKQTATGVILVPRIKDRPMTPEEVEELPDDEKEKIEKKKHELHIRIEQVLTEVRAMEKEVKLSVKELEKEIALFSVKHIINEHRAKYKDFEDVVQHLNRVQEDIITNLDIFKDEEEASPNVLFGMKPMPKDDVFKKYQVNLLVDHSHSEGAPVIVEPNPTYYNLLGRIEYVAHFGAMTTDFTMIAPGSLHMANGGYLILQAVDVLTTFMAWDVLKKIIRNQQIKVEDINEQFRLITTTSLKPKPIPCNIKIIMIGSPWVYHILFRYDDDFRKMFKVKADFDTEMERSVDKINKYAAFIKARCEDERLRHFDRKAVAAIVDYASRIAGDQQKLSARFMFIADMLRESNYWAAKDHAQYVNAQHVEKAIQEKIYRSNLIEEKISALIKDNTLMIDVEGKKTGEINGLAVYDVGGYAFGKPTKITVATFMGKNGVIDIERQTKMGGDIHSKGILILSGFIGERFAQNYPLNLNASVCFEQSYDGVDGDSASSTEVYCLLSSLSGVPLKQYIAVTGSMNQHGVIQPIGGVNEKIEGFYHICKLKGLDGRHGVMIPETNVRHLMLKEEVVKAVKAGKFHIWAVASIDEGIEILTGKKAGVKDKKGEYPKGTINYLVDKKLKEYMERTAAQDKKGKGSKKPKRTKHEA
jgi:lon-related putative ATP-dependent protease